MSDRDPNTPVILAVLASEDMDPVDESILGECYDCKESVWLAPTSQEILAKAKDEGLEIDPICLYCLIQRESSRSPEDEDVSVSMFPDEFLDAVRDQAKEKNA